MLWQCNEEFQQIKTVCETMPLLHKKDRENSNKKTICPSFLHLFSSFTSTVVLLLLGSLVKFIVLAGMLMFYCLFVCLLF